MTAPNISTTVTASLGPIQLMPGVMPRHLLTFFYASFIGITLNTYVNFIQPYVLRVQLGIPDEEQGKFTGDLVFYSEIILLMGCAVAGALADRISRRVVFTLGLLILAFAYSLYGFVDQSVELLLLRLVFALGMAFINVMVSTVQADYPQEASRGKLVGFTGLSIGLGAVFLALVLSQLPSWYGVNQDDKTAGLYALLTVSAIAFVSALVILTGLWSGPELNKTAEKSSWVTMLKESMQAAVDNPRVALAYGCAFVARGDLIVIGVFFSLWLNQVGVSQGLSAGDALKQAGIFFLVVQFTALLWAPVSGLVIDRLNRVVAMAISLLLAAIGYGSMGFIVDPLGVWMYPAAVLLGIGQMSVMSASQTLIGQEAPERIRGSVMGMFSIAGAVGILFITKVGGIVFDQWKPGPFVIVAVINLLLCLVAIGIVRQGNAESSQPLSE
ncbi:MFS transporter [Oceanicoccus sagamiensis]|uniref:Major facilitator superfamily (MFS) profile domain-containing protein n=1 Tax=Oceanicoccus sagamiensis TaxID=716816 RepID=A0A1X9N9V2_9GAMM|nr:MFS transporter [Oceanicoccus sagamiensis]ARN73202.1 hypothetical protein BST96_03220 [Oceanicoccus sagamiensis]